MHPHAAGIDIGGSEHWVATSPEKDEEPVRRFDCFTADVEQMADWLVDRGVGGVEPQVAMQSCWRFCNSQSAAYQEPAWAQERHCRMSVAAQAAYLRTTEQQLPAQRRNPHGAHLVVASGRVGGAGQQQGIAPRVDPEAPPLGPRPQGKRAQGNAPQFDLRSELYRITGVD